MMAQNHSYIGDMEEVRSNVDVILNYEKNEETDNLAIIPFHDLVLFPGESIPLRLRKSFFHNIPNAIDLIRQQEQSINSNQYFFPFHLGIVYHLAKENSIGVSCEIKFSTVSVYDIFSSNNIDDNEYIHLVATAIFRFKIKSIRLNKGISIGTVQFLFDTENKNCRLSNMNSFPDWVYLVYGSENLARQALHLYSKIILLNDTEIDNDNNSIINYETISELLQNPTKLSYYIASNLPTDNSTRLSLLHCDNTPNRLMSCIQLIKNYEDQVLQCLVCSQNLGNISDMFTVPGSEGSVGAYISSGGIVHQTVTLRRLLNSCHLIHHGRPEPKDSWFNGYAWTIICCGICTAHLGWYFTSTERSPFPDLNNSFYGFRRASLKKAD